MSRSYHEKVIRTAVRAIKEIDVDRLIIADGLSWGNEPAPELAHLAISQSCRGYKPMRLTHYMARWVGGERFHEPVWPGTQKDGPECDRTRLAEHYEPWSRLIGAGVGVHCGECGCYSFTPHRVAMAWFADLLDILKQHGIGWALWNFRGPFGILDSERRDVEYHDWFGHKLDVRMLDLLRRHGGSG